MAVPATEREHPAPGQDRRPGLLRAHCASPLPAHDPDQGRPSFAIKISVVVTRGTTGKNPVHFSLNECQDYDSRRGMGRGKGRRKIR